MFNARDEYLDAKHPGRLLRQRKLPDGSRLRSIMDMHETGAPLPFHAIDLARMMRALTGETYSVGLGRPLPSETLGWDSWTRARLGLPTKQD
jgi:hypothetical protein